MKNIEASVTIVKDSNNMFNIEFLDMLSGTRFARCSMTPHDFAMALSGMANVKAECQVMGFDHVGKLREIEPRSIDYPGGYDRESAEEWLAENAQEPGWILNNRLRSQDSFGKSDSGGTVLRYSVTRYVEVNDD